jgi:Transposase, Mutator family
VLTDVVDDPDVTTSAPLVVVEAPIARDKSSPPRNTSSISARNRSAGDTRFHTGPTTLRTTAGPITLQRPKLRNTTEGFASQLFGKGVTKTNALESLVLAGFVRGLSTRDVEAALTAALGEQAAVSKSTVSHLRGSRSSSKPGANTSREQADGC